MRGVSVPSSSIACREHILRLLLLLLLLMSWWTPWEERVRIVRQAPSVVDHASTGAVGTTAVSCERESIGVAVEVPQAVVVEGRRSVLLVARVRRDQKEWTVVQTAIHEELLLLLLRLRRLLLGLGGRRCLATG